MPASDLSRYPLEILPVEIWDKIFKSVAYPEFLLWLVEPGDHCELPRSHSQLHTPAQFGASRRHPPRPCNCHRRRAPTIPAVQTTLSTATKLAKRPAALSLTQPIPNSARVWHPTQKSSRERRSGSTRGCWGRTWARPSNNNGEGAACAWTRSTAPAHASRRFGTILNDDKGFVAHGALRPFETMLDDAQKPKPPRPVLRVSNESRLVPL
ncbi:hypothetical protein HMN09_00347900 [Mycena chlorophos]|uniref:Uncharacterized protein n=1 Tax=Mycena chlorophos TaxID=658473 RepID=A0A8H6TKG4_MYCCL|nr:hypothetical protein HMN09_00347900 [Mycena chlorophos]